MNLDMYRISSILLWAGIFSSSKKIHLWTIPMGGIFYYRLYKSFSQRLGKNIDYF